MAGPSGWLFTCGSSGPEKHAGGHLNVGAARGLHKIEHRQRDDVGIGACGGVAVVADSDLADGVAGGGQPGGGGQPQPQQKKPEPPAANVGAPPGGEPPPAMMQ